MDILDKKPVRDSNAMFRIIKDEALIILPSRGETKVLNDVGTAIWNLLDGDRSVRDIVDEVKEIFSDAPEAEVCGDVVEFLRELEVREMLNFPPE